MKRFIKWVQNYLIYSFPAVLLIMAWGSFQDQEEIQSALLKNLWGLLGWNIMVWFVALIGYLVALVLIPTLREQVLTRLANIKERDEREEYITGRAARTSYISTMSLLIFFLFLSIFTVNIKKEIPASPNGTTNSSKPSTHGSVNLGLNFSLLDKSTDKKEQEGVVFESSNIPISKPAILLTVLLWQIFSFAITARRQRSELAD